MMRKIFLIALLSISTIAISQPWLKNLPAKKSNKEITFYDYQNAFSKYWQGKSIKNGYYYENGIKKKAPGWKQFKRWEYNMEGKINPETGEFPKRTAQQVYDKYKKLNKTKGSTAANWTNLGVNSSTGGYAGIGRINCIAFHPSDNNTYWVGAPAGGLWLTSDNGSSWTCLTDNNSVLGISDIIIPSDFATSKTIYIATGDRDGNDNYSIGVLKSTDAGITWNTTGLSFSLSNKEMTTRLLLDPNNDETIIAATSNGVYKTTNAGITWSSQLTAVSFIDMEYKPNDYSTLYGSTKTGKIYVSTNSGLSWAMTFENGERIELAVTPANPNIVYAVVSASDNSLYGVYKSSNSSLSYVKMLDGATLNILGWDSDGQGEEGQGWYDLSIAASLTDSNIVLVGGINTWRSVNGGASWSIITHWTSGSVQTIHADKHMLKYRKNGDLFECNDGGVYYSSDNGTNFTDKSNGLVISQMYKLGVSQNSSSEIITGLQDNGTKLLSSGTWRDVKSGDGMECIIDYTNDNIQYATYTNGQISRTTNHWNSLYTDIEPDGGYPGAWVTPYIIDPVSHNTLYAGYADVWKTTDRGDNWTKISTMNTSYNLRSMAIAPSNVSVLYVADYYDIWKTTNGGISWDKITNLLPTTFASIRYITVKNDDENTLWLAMSGYNQYGVYQSIDGGSNWTNISTGLPELPVYSIVQNTQSTGEVHLYASTELGVYFKKGSDNWVEYNTGLPNVKTAELEIYYDDANSDNTRLRAATYGRGLWETVIESRDTNNPYLSTSTVTSIIDTSAIGAGVLLDAGTSIITERGIVWSLNSNPTITDNKIADTSTAIGSFSLSITGLSADTKYYVRAYAINSNGAFYGNNVSFISMCEIMGNLPYFENFENFENGNYMDENSDLWQTWSDSSGTSEDAKCSNAQASSGTKSMLISGTNDMIFPLCNITEGNYQIEFNIYIDSGYSGYFNFQHIFASEWASEVYFGKNGIGELLVENKYNYFEFYNDKWIPIKAMFDLDKNYAQLMIDSVIIHTWHFNSTANYTDGTNQLSVINFYAGETDSLNPKYYIDDFRISNAPICSAPTIQVSDIYASNITSNSMQINYTRGNGKRVMGVVNVSNPVDIDPTPLTVYSMYSDLGMGNIIIYDGAADSIVINGLSPGTKYYGAIYEYNEWNCYLTPAAIDSFTTKIPCDFNYSADDAQNATGTYTDLGTSGSEIMTSNNDDANSSAIDIGFNFILVCDSFSQFILNTNGFIKLGAVPPSSPSLFFSGASNSAGGIFNSASGSDINILAAFNHDLTDGTNTPEYRVYTSGSSPYRVCTIQFKNIRDKTTSPAQQYDNIEFQIKLFETSNIIEFVYGDWSASSNSSAFKTSGCGIKGTSNSSSDMITVNKGSSWSWSDSEFSNGNYYSTSTQNFGNPTARPKPDIGRTFRFIPPLDKNIEVGNIYALKDFSINFGNPQIISTNIINSGSDDISSFSTVIKVTGAASFIDTIIISNLKSNEDTIINFNSFSTYTTGINNIEVSVFGDDYTGDNTNSFSQNSTDYTYNYSKNNTPSSAYGFGSFSDGISLTKYHISGTAQVNSIEAFIYDYNNNIGQVIYGVVLDENGAIIARSSDYTILSSDMDDWYSFTLDTPSVITDKDFYVGVACTLPNNMISYYAVGTQKESPLRENVFYTSEITGGTMSEKTSESSFMIGATVAYIPPVGGITDAVLDTFCLEGNTRISVSGTTGSIQWQKSENGTSNWIDVTNSVGDSVVYLTDTLYKDTYYRTKLSQPDYSSVYSSISKITINSLPVLTLGLDDTIKLSDTIVLNPGEGFLSYLWNDSSTSQRMNIIGVDKGIGTYVYSVSVTDSNMCSNSDTIIIFIDNSVGQLQNGETDRYFKIYPNPNNGFFNLEINNLSDISSVNIEITDIKGRVIYNKNIEEAEKVYEIDMTEYPKGLYYIRVVGDESVNSTHKLIIH